MTFDDPFQAAATSLLQALRRYEEGWQRLAEQGLDRPQFLRVDQELKTVQRLAACFPVLATDFRDLILHHSQLLLSLSKSAAGRSKADLAALRRRLRLAAALLRCKAMALADGLVPLPAVR